MNSGLLIKKVYSERGGQQVFTFAKSLVNPAREEYMPRSKFYNMSGFELLLLFNSTNLYVLGT